jgi:hypothetical protein
VEVSSLLFEDIFAVIDFELSSCVRIEMRYCKFCIQLVSDLQYAKAVALYPLFVATQLRKTCEGMTSLLAWTPRVEHVCTLNTIWTACIIVRSMALRRCLLSIEYSDEGGATRCETGVQKMKVVRSTLPNNRGARPHT